MMLRLMEEVVGRLMEQLEVVGMREKVSDYFDVTLACKDGERISAQFCYNLSI